MKRRLTRKRALISMVIVFLLVLFVVPKINYVDSKKELINRTIEIALVSRKIPDFNLIKDKKNIIVSSENIEGTLLPEIPNINLIILSPKEIQEKANREGDFLFLTFSKVDIGNWSAAISLDNIWAISDNSKNLYLSGGGMVVKFYNLFGKWIKKKSIGMWISFDSNDVRSIYISPC